VRQCLQAAYNFIEGEDGWNFAPDALHASAFVTGVNILLWTVGSGMVSGSQSFAVLLFAAY